MTEFNDHQKDTRNRADSLVKSIFILAGGTLTLSISNFLDKTKEIKLDDCLTVILKGSWWALFISIVSLALTLFTIIVRDYRFGEKWRSSFFDESVDLTNKPGKLETVIWIFAVIGIISFILGFLAQAYVATNLL